jgi:hypothetical protein
MIFFLGRAAISPPSTLRAAYAARCARGPDPAYLPAWDKRDSALALLPSQGV